MSEVIKLDGPIRFSGGADLPLACLSCGRACPHKDIPTGAHWLCQQCSREGKDAGQKVQLVQFCCICWTLENVKTVREDGEWLCDEHAAASWAGPRDPVEDKVSLGGSEVKRLSAKKPEPEPIRAPSKTGHKLEPWQW